jgi:hypothetical protein
LLQAPGWHKRPGIFCRQRHCEKQSDEAIHMVASTFMGIASPLAGDANASHAACCHHAARSDRDAAIHTNRTAVIPHSLAGHRKAAAWTRGVWRRVGEATGHRRASRHRQGDIGAYENAGCGASVASRDDAITNNYGNYNTDAGTSVCYSAHAETHISRTSCHGCDAATVTT